MNSLIPKGCDNLRHPVLIGIKSSATSIRRCSTQWTTKLRRSVIVLLSVSGDLGLLNVYCSLVPIRYGVRLPQRQRHSLIRHVKRKQRFSVSCQGQSTISFIMDLLGELRKGKGGFDWTVTCSYLESILSLIKTTTAGKSHGIVVHQEVARMWESFREMTSTHNVIFESSEGEVSAHDQVLMISSPVLKAMLETSMKEGSCRRIDIKDSSSRGISLFLDLLYTSSSAIADLDYKTMLVALDLAHRWQVQHIVDMLTNLFAAGDQCRQLWGDCGIGHSQKHRNPYRKPVSPSARRMPTFRPCFRRTVFPPAVAKLMGMSEADRAEATTSKRRRFS